MPALKTYNLFISHAWQYDDDYHRLLALLRAAPYFEFANYSVPEHDPLHAETTLGLTRALYRQMRPSHVVLLLAGMYAHHREWIHKEIEIAQELGKPIVGVIPRGQVRTSEVVQDAAEVMVHWNTASIVDAVRRYAL